MCIYAYSSLQDPVPDEMGYCQPLATNIIKVSSNSFCVNMFCIDGKVIHLFIFLALEHNFIPNGQGIYINEIVWLANRLQKYDLPAWTALSIVVIANCCIHQCFKHHLIIYNQISWNIIDILCLHIFFWIRSNFRITYIVFGGNWFMYCP